MNGKSRIGVMPRFGDAESIIWFDVENHCSYHLFNWFEGGNEVNFVKSKCIPANIDTRESYDNKPSIFSNNLYKELFIFSCFMYFDKKPVSRLLSEAAGYWVLLYIVTVIELTSLNGMEGHFSNLIRIQKILILH
jgi:hypothetical protein